MAPTDRKSSSIVHARARAGPNHWRPARNLALSLLATLVASACDSNEPPTPDPTSPAAQLATPSAAPLATGSSTIAPTSGLEPSQSTAFPSPSASAVPVRLPDWNDCPGEKASGSGRALRENSPNWAGYITYGPKRRTVGCVEGSWVHPEVTCPAKGYAAVSIWVGMDGVHSGTTGIDASGTLQQIGTQASCTDGQLVNFAWEEVLPLEPHSVPVNLPVEAGDKIRASVRYVTDQRFDLRIDNVTKARTVTVIRYVEGARRQTAEWVVEAVSQGCPGDCAIQRLADFDRIRFSGAFATIAERRQPVAGSSLRYSRLTFTRGGVTRAETRRLGDGRAAFTVVWRHR